MSDFALPGLRDRIFSGARFVRGPRDDSRAGPLTLGNVGGVAAATVTAAAVAGLITWMQAPAGPAKPDLAIKPTLDAAAPLASTTIGKTHQQVDNLAGLRSDPTLRLDTASAWSPAGGLSILTAPSAPPADRVAALPMPAPIVAAANMPRPVATAEADDVPLPLPRATPSSVAAIPVRPQTAPPPTAVATAPSAAVDSTPPSGGFFGMLEHFFTPQESRTATALLSSNPRTAIYDISAHVVYMPGGETLEAHSGLGQWLDDPSSFNRKDRGVTPPNVYKISLREKPFHGVQALRLTPVGDARMYGRDGMLAHTYMLGENGQSNGCVSFKDYDKFLQAFASGAVDRLIVVPKITSATAYAQASSSS
jgi:hypothetical protein